MLSKSVSTFLKGKSSTLKFASQRNFSAAKKKPPIPAAETNFDAYFNTMANESVFIGTDATENWNKKEFMEFSKPFFDKGKAWSFTSLKRSSSFLLNSFSFSKYCC